MERKKGLELEKARQEVEIHGLNVGEKGWRVQWAGQ
jgi:hypothetical protein